MGIKELGADELIREVHDYKLFLIVGGLLLVFFGVVVTVLRSASTTRTNAVFLAKSKGGVKQR